MVNLFLNIRKIINFSKKKKKKKLLAVFNFAIFMSIKLLSQGLSILPHQQLAIINNNTPRNATFIIKYMLVIFYIGIINC